MGKERSHCKEREVTGQGTRGAETSPDATSLEKSLRNDVGTRA